MSSTTRVLIGLATGVGAGFALRAVDNSFNGAIVSVIEPIGTLWLNALRMTVIPLVVSMLISGVSAASDAAVSGKIALRTLLVIIVLLVGSAFFGGIVSPAAFALFPSDASRAAT